MAPTTLGLASTALHSVFSPVIKCSDDPWVFHLAREFTPIALL